MTPINKIQNFNSISFKNVDSNFLKISTPIDNQPRNFDSNFYIDKKGAEAIKSKNFVANPIDINKPMSMDDYINKLTRAGLVENKDFEVIKDRENGGGSIYITKGQEKLFKVVRWHDGNSTENYNGYEDHTYPINQGDLSEIVYSYDSDGYLEDKRMEYSNPDAHKDLFPDNIDITTSSDEYARMLGSKNIKHKIDKTKVDNQGVMTSIQEYNNENREEKSVTFFEYPNGDRTIFYEDTPGIDGIFTHRVDLCKDGDFYRLCVTENEKYKGNKVKNTVKY